MPGLTPKQETFAHRYVQSGNASDAYRFAYNTENMKVETIKKRASELLAHGDVSGTIESLKAAQMREIDVTAADISRVAWSIANADDASHGSRVSALALLAKRHHEFSDKHEVSSDVRLQAMQAVASMDTAQLRALAESLRDDT
jgi:phage terminase small subunit